MGNAIVGEKSSSMKSKSMLVGTKRVKKTKIIDEDTDTLKRHRSEMDSASEAPMGS
jgi:hypothetical protein